MTKLFSVIAALFAALTVTVSATSVTSGSSTGELVPYHIDELGMSISLPADAYATGRNVAADFPLLEKYGMTVEQLQKNYYTRDIYFNAVWYDSDAEATEIVVSMVENSETRTLYDLDRADEERINWIEELYRSYGEEGTSGEGYSSVELVDCGGVDFFRAEGSSKGEKRRNLVEYMTIVNGQKVEISLIEYMPADDASDRTTVSEAHRQIIDSVMQTVRFDRIKNAFFAKNPGLVRFGIALLAAAVLIGAYLAIDAVSRKRKPQKTEDEHTMTLPAQSEAEQLAEAGGTVFAQTMTFSEGFDIPDAAKESPAEEPASENGAPNGGEEPNGEKTEETTAAEQTEESEVCENDGENGKVEAE